MSAAQLSGAQSARSFFLSASGAQKLIDDRWARAHPKITERERKLALIFALKMEPLSLIFSILRQIKIT